MTFPSMNALAANLRETLDGKDKQEGKKYILLFAYNGTGKTRLSMEFKEIGKKEENGVVTRDTLYFNAFTEDLFNWDNDLDDDESRELRLNTKSIFFDKIFDLDMENRIRPLLSRYADFGFKILKKKITVNGPLDAEGVPIGSYTEEITHVSFERDVLIDGNSKKIENIKISRGEENIFIWCFFLAICELAIGGHEGHTWIKYIYIDDPISSLDEHNAIAVANHLTQMLKQDGNKLKTVISTHHPLFFNVLCNELGSAKKYLLSKGEDTGSYILRDTGETPFFHHVATLVELYQAEKSGKIYTHHFNTLRQLLEKTASFHGLKGFADCIKKDPTDTDGILYTRLINILSHGNYSLYEPQDMLEENKKYFSQILHNFLDKYPFNPDLFPKEATESATT